MWDDGEYIGYTELEAIDGAYVVQAQRNAKNEVVYTYLRTEGTPPDILPTADEPLFKLQTESFRSVSELAQILEAKDQLVEIYAGDSVVSAEKVRTALASGDIIKYRNNVYWVADFLPEGQGPIGQQGRAKEMKRKLTQSSLEEKKQRRLTFTIPATLDASEDMDTVFVENTVLERTLRTGQVTTACLSNCKWFICGSKRDLPKHANRSFMGRYKDTYVWVPPHGRDQLAKLTLAVLDIAMNSAPTSATTDVYAFVAADGKTTTTYDKAQFLAKATLGRGKSLSGLLPSSADSTQPPRDEEIDMLESVRDNLRLSMIRILVEDLGVSDIFALIDRLEIREDASVEYVGGDYIKRKLDVQNGDLMIAVASAVLTESGREAIEAIRSMPFTSESTDLLSSAARDYLNAESRLQEIVGVAAPPDPSAPSYTGTQSPKSQPRINAFQFQQTIDFLGL